MHHARAVLLAIVIAACVPAMAHAIESELQRAIALFEVTQNVLRTMDAEIARARERFDDLDRRLRDPQRGLDRALDPAIRLPVERKLRALRSEMAEVLLALEGGQGRIQALRLGLCGRYPELSPQLNDCYRSFEFAYKRSWKESARLIQDLDSLQNWLSDRWRRRLPLEAAPTPHAPQAVIAAVTVNGPPARRNAAAVDSAPRRPRGQPTVSLARIIGDDPPAAVDWTAPGPEANAVISLDGARLVNVAVRRRSSRAAPPSKEELARLMEEVIDVGPSLEANLPARPLRKR